MAGIEDKRCRLQSEGSGLCCHRAVRRTGPPTPPSTVSFHCFCIHLIQVVSQDAKLPCNCPKPLCCHLHERRSQLKLPLTVKLGYNTAHRSSLSNNHQLTVTVTVKTQLETKVLIALRLLIYLLTCTWLVSEFCLYHCM